jgi:hypothetical protein
MWRQNLEVHTVTVNYTTLFRRLKNLDHNFKVVFSTKVLEASQQSLLCISKRQNNTIS